jgi:hypothetical protein
VPLFRGKGGQGLGGWPAAAPPLARLPGGPSRPHAATGTLVRAFKGHSEPVESVAFSRDGARLLSGSQDKTIKLWDAATGKLVRTFKGRLLRGVASWDKPRRVLAKVEWHPGELFPRVGFLVTNPPFESEQVFGFYNQRGTAEQYIKEGKMALKWTRLSCKTMAQNEVRLQLHALAYNLGMFLQSTDLPRRGRHLVADELADASDQDRRPCHPACTHDHLPARRGGDLMRPFPPHLGGHPASPTVASTNMTTDLSELTRNRRHGSAPSSTVRLALVGVHGTAASASVCHRHERPELVFRQIGMLARNWLKRLREQARRDSLSCSKGYLGNVGLSVV